MLDSLLSVLLGGTAGAAIVWLLRGWISERLRQAIAHEYSEKLQLHKMELDARLQSLRHQYETDQLRTSLFFDHQRLAFAEILAKIAAVNDAWLDEGHDPFEGLSHPVPRPSLGELRALYFKHQLFLDAECRMAMELLFDSYYDSLPDDSDPSFQPDPNIPYDNVQYLAPRLATLFQERLGMLFKHSDTQAPRRSAAIEISLLGAMRMLNRYHFREIGLPVSGNLKAPHRGGVLRASDAVRIAERHRSELIQKLAELQQILAEDPFFHMGSLDVNRYLAVLRA